MRSVRRLLPVALGAGLLAATPAVAGAVDFSFDAKKVVVDDSLVPGFIAPTAIQVSPDGSQLYVAADKDVGGGVAELGYIHVFDLDANNNATLVQTISTVYDYGQNNKDLVSNGNSFELTESSQFFKDLGRRVTGLTLAEEGGQPVLYVAHSDPRNNENSQPGQSGVDPTSGVLTKLSGPSFGQVRHLAVGLPRSAEHHGPNGMSIDDGWLYLSLGGNTNHGLESLTFGYYPETPLAASVVRFDLSDFEANQGLQVDASDGSDFYFTDPCGPGETVGSGCSADTDDDTPGDASVPGTFERYADGFRNGYDLTWHSNGNLYLNDNGGNDGFGDSPQNANCSGSFNPGDEVDELFLVQQGGYHGHPNPSRDQCVWDGGVQSIASYGISTSTNGITEYLANLFGDAQGTLISANFSAGDNLVYAKLNGAGTAVTEQGTVASNLNNPLDVHTNSSGDLFVAEYGVFSPTFEISQSTVSVFEPNLSCVVQGGNNDSDGDGISDANEQAVGTNPCSAADVPPDLDRDGIPDQIDPDIDGDGIPNGNDAYQLDPSNGSGNTLPIDLSFDLAGSGWYGSGFPGIQGSSRGGGPVDGQVGVGGAGGFMQFRATDGTMIGDANDQDNALQIGVPGTQAFVASTIISEPFQNIANPAGQTSASLFFGPGEDAFARVAINANNGSPIIELGSEQSPYVRAASAPLPGGAATVTLFLEAQPAVAKVIGKYKVGDGPIQTLGSIDVPPSWFTSVVPVGLATTRVGNPGDPVAFVLQEFSVAGTSTTPGPGSGGGQPPAGGGSAPPAGGNTAAASGSAVCNPVPERAASKKGTIRYTRQALKIQQNIDSAVIRRLNAVNAWIDAGIVPTDLCAGAFGPSVFQPGMTFANAAPHDPSPPSPREIEIVKKNKKGNPITKSRRQLAINENISRALRARAQATAKRIVGLTGGNLAPGASLAGRAAYPGLTPSGARPPAAEPAATELEIGPLPKRITIRPNAATVRKQQRRSQGSIILANRALDAITAGLTEENFRSGSIGSNRI